ncbi:hypothetical protein BH09BAC1_BH09BAC1_02250 [soil metagenome]
MKTPQEDESSKEPQKHEIGKYPIKETETKDEENRTDRHNELNHSLKDQGMDDAQAAGIANTQDTGSGAADSHIYEEMTMEQLYEEAKKAGIGGYYDMRRNDVVMALKQQRKEY